MSNIPRPHTPLETLPALLKMKVLFINGVLKIVPVEINKNDSKSNAIRIRPYFGDGIVMVGGSTETADCILTIPCEEWTTKQKDFLLGVSVHINAKGQLVDDSTEELLGSQHDFHKLVALAKSVDGKSQVMDELNLYREALDPFAHYFVESLFKERNHGN